MRDDKREQYMLVQYLLKDTGRSITKYIAQVCRNCDGVCELCDDYYSLKNAILDMHNLRHGGKL